MEYWAQLFLGGSWVTSGTLLLYVAWRTQWSASPFRTSLSVTAGVLMLLGGLIFLFHSQGYGQDN